MKAHLELGLSSDIWEEGIIHISEPCVHVTGARSCGGSNPNLNPNPDPDPNPLLLAVLLGEGFTGSALIGTTMSPSPCKL